jgi:hypothetical protein
MRGAGGQLAFEFGGNAGTGRSRSVRRVRRDATMRLVEYAPFPRVHRDQQWRHGFTLDLSPRGLCVRAKEVAPIGSLLRIIVRSVDGRPSLDAVARVAWVARTPGGNPRMGLEIVASRDRRPLSVAPPSADLGLGTGGVDAPLAGGPVALAS